jgi:hypothetical protein
MKRANLIVSFRQMSRFDDLQKNGEVVGPAGGETGGPRCLAEVRKLPKAALFH